MKKIMCFACINHKNRDATKCGLLWDSRLRGNDRMQQANSIMEYFHPQTVNFFCNSSSESTRIINFPSGV